MKKLTPILVVEEIEPSLSFWVDRMGFEKTAEVPEADKLGFVILARKVDGMDLILPYRETFYGAKELWLREPGGHIIGFAEMSSGDTH